jgi:hypothetical protein
VATVFTLVLLLTPAMPAGAQVAHGPDVELPLCSFMSQAEAAVLVGQPVEHGQGDAPGWLRQCVFTGADQNSGASLSIQNWGTPEAAEESYDLRLFASNVTERLGPAGAVRTNDYQTELLAHNGPFLVTVTVWLPVVKPTGADLSPFATRMFDALEALN